jgi:hypothetical protein
MTACSTDGTVYDPYQRLAGPSLSWQLWDRRLPTLRNVKRDRKRGQDQDSPISPEGVIAFSNSAGFFGFDRRQTRRFLGVAATRLAELEQEVAEWRAKEDAIAESLIVASTTARIIEDAAAARAGQVEQEAAARIAKLEQESLVERVRLVNNLRQAAWNLNDLIGMISPEVQQPADAPPTAPSTDAPEPNGQLMELRIDRHAS